MTEQKTQTLYGALLAFQKGAPIIIKDETNPFYKSKYADLPAVWQTVQALLAEHNLLVLNTVSAKDGRDILTTKIMYVPTGEFIESDLPINPAKSDPQGYGAAITYHRRQNLTSLLGLVCDNEDDDGNAASGKTEAAKPAPRAAPKAENPLKETAAKISAQLKESDSLEVLDYVWNGFKSDLDKIRAASPDKAYPALEKVYKERKDELDQIPV